MNKNTNYEQLRHVSYDQFHAVRQNGTLREREELRLHYNYDEYMTRYQNEELFTILKDIASHKPAPAEPAEPAKPSPSAATAKPD